MGGEKGETSKIFTEAQIREVLGREVVLLKKTLQDFDKRTTEAYDVSNSPGIFDPRGELGKEMAGMVWADKSRTQERLDEVLKIAELLGIKGMEEKTSEGTGNT